MANEVRIEVTSRDRSGPGFQSARRNADELGSSTQRIGEIAAGVVTSQVFEQIADGASRAFTSTVAASSNLSESVNAVGVVFGEQGDKVLQWGEDNASAYGLSKRAFNEAVVPMGALLKNTGLDMDTVSAATMDLSARAGDMASVFNTDVNTALAAINAGLRGEADPLEQFGVGLNAAAVEARALADTGKSVASELTDQEKVMARVNLILEQTADLEGDAIKTGEDYAGSVRRRQAATEDFQATVGDSLTPALAALNTILSATLGWLEGLPEPLLAVIGAFLGLAGLAGKLAPVIMAVNVALQSTSISIRSVMLALGPIGLAIAGVTALMSLFSGDTEEADQTVQAYADTLDQATGSITDATREMAFLELQESGLIDKAEELGISTRDLVDAFLGEEEAARRVRDQLDGVIEAGTDTVEVFQRGADGGSYFKTVLNDDAKAAQELKDSLVRGNDTIDEAREKIRQAGDAGVITADQMDVLTDAVEAGLESWRKGLSGFSNAVGDYNSLLSDAEEKEKERAQTVADQTSDATDSWEDHVGDVTVSIDDLIAKQEEQITAMEDWADNIAALAQEGIDEGFLQELIDAGPESAGLVQTLVDAPKKKRDEYVKNWAKTSGDGMEAFAETLANAQPQLERIARVGGEKTADKIRAGLINGAPTVEAAAVRIGKLVVRDFNGEIRHLADLKPALSRTHVNQEKAYLSRSFPTKDVPIRPRRNSMAGTYVNRWLNNISRSRDSRIDAERGYDNASWWLQNIARNRVVRVDSYYGRIIGNRPEYASGGVVGARRGMQGGGMSGATEVLVGEHRPEVVELPFGSRVIPSVDQASDRGQSWAGGPAKVELVIDSSGSRLDDLLLEVLRNSIRVRGGNVQTVLGRR